MNIEEMSVESSFLFMSDITHFKSKDKLTNATSLLRLLIKMYCIFVIIHLRGTLLVSGGRVSCKLANQSPAAFSQEKNFEVIYLKSFMGEQTGSCLALFLWKLKHGGWGWGWGGI